MYRACVEYIVSWLFLLPPRGNPNRVSYYTKHVHEIKTDGIDLAVGLKVDHVENLVELNNLNNNVYKINEIKFLKQHFKLFQKR